MLLPYGEMRNTRILAKIGGHGSEGKVNNREVRGKIVSGVKRTGGN